MAEGHHPASGVLLFEDPATTSKTRRSHVHGVSRAAVRTALAGLLPDQSVPSPRSA
ncbi:hypothetical protein [Actinomadura rubrisoli]|uniref:hypothetical protein n=1 Tax=Actinomadura rubrisoli TaxID=2530368 RepID=UPI001404F1AB|nr:hypothetical protein [Actinomadura rubrisoli]